MHRQNKRPGGRGAATMAVFFFGLLAVNYAQYQLSPLGPEITAALGLNAAQFSSAFSAPMIPAFLLSFFAGALSDRWGVRRVAGVGLAVSALGTALRPLCGSYLGLMGSMVLLGVGMAFLNANTAKVVGNWYPPQRAGTVAGAVLTSSPVGMTAALATTALLPSAKAAYWVAFAVCAAAALLWLLLMRERPEGAPDAPVKEEAAPPSAGESIAVAARSRSVWLAGGCMACLMGACILLNAFLPSALQQVRGMAAAAAGVAASAVTVGNIFGALLGPVLLQKTGSLKGCLIGAGAVFGLGAAFGWLLPQGLVMGAVLFVTGVALGMFFPLLLSLPATLPEIGPRYAGAAGGIIATLQMLGGFLLPTYLVAPLAGGSYPVLFGAAGGLMALLCLLALAFPCAAWGRSAT
ncbi:MFS transporter [Oscillospiraceae bacterium 52-8]